MSQTKTVGKYMLFWPCDLGLRLGDCDSHIIVKLELSWQRIRKESTAEARRARQQAARKARKRAAPAEEPEVQPRKRAALASGSGEVPKPPPGDSPGKGGGKRK